MRPFEVGTLGLNEVTHLVARGMRHLADNALEQWFCPNNTSFLLRKLKIGGNPLLNA